MNGEISMTPGAVLLVLMKQLETMTDDELRTVVRTKVTSDAERRSYERLSENASRDVLVLLSAKVLTHQVLECRTF